MDPDLTRVRIVLRYFVLAFSGALVAVFTDFFASSDGSLLYHVSNLTTRITPDLPVLFPSALGLAIIGGSSIFYFRPLTDKGAWASGFATIGVFAIFAP